MGLFQIIALVVSFTAIFSVVGERLLNLPKVIGPMLVAVVLSLLLVGAETLGIGLEPQQVASMLAQLDFSAVVMDGLLGFLLFAGAMHVPIRLLEEQSLAVFSLAIVSTLVSTLVIGGLLWWVSGWLGLPLSFPQALVFGALISPTDPVAVLALLKNAKLPKRLEVIISGESLFNDGVAVALFTILSAIAFSQSGPTPAAGLGLILQEVGGGLAAGFLIGIFAYWLLENTKEQSTQVLITLAVATGGYSLAQVLHVSGPLAMVVAGLFVGNFGLRETMDRASRRNVDTFWTITDDVLNAVLFVLIGIQILVLPGWSVLALGLLAITLHLSGRFVGVLIPTLMLQPHKRQYDGVWWDFVGLLTWSGLRGGVSVALVLTLPEGEVRDVLMGMTYAIVLFSVVIQGLTIGHLFRRRELLRMAERAKEL